MRTTRDVDVIVEAVSLGEYHTLERQLEQAGLRHDRSPDAPVCRWLAGSALLDVMPTDKAVLGFGNRWYEEAVRTAVTHAASTDIRKHLSTKVKRLLESHAFLYALPGHLPGDSLSQARVPLILERLQRLSRLA